MGQSSRGREQWGRARGPSAWGRARGAERVGQRLAVSPPGTCQPLPLLQLPPLPSSPAEKQLKNTAFSHLPTPSPPSRRREPSCSAELLQEGRYWGLEQGRSFSPRDPRAATGQESHHLRLAPTTSSSSKSRHVGGTRAQTERKAAVEEKTASRVRGVRHSISGKLHPFLRNRRARNSPSCFLHNRWDTSSVILTSSRRGRDEGQRIEPPSRPNSCILAVPSGDTNAPTSSRGGPGHLVLRRAA
ncbi:unnamed protein product [Nyctereutes procyonoides]|uniref:(raccoon dog) hypothetical protein n=1 Tax=Nyctereutes procyonoides TaxID=34880 RepID=A0A811ZE92_NYCPR|nr:unnamed protein product [Nyctereutes procyonoides]